MDIEENLCRTELREECEILVPKSFTVDEMGNFYILDTLNNKVKIYSETGVYIDYIELPSQIYGLDIEKVNDNIFIYADDCNLYKINEYGQDCLELVTTILRENIAGIFRGDNELFVRSYNGSDLRISCAEESNIMRKDVAEFTVIPDDMVIGLKNDTNIEVLSIDENVSQNLYCTLEPAGAYCLKNENDILYTLSNETDWKYTETRISRVQEDGVLETALTVSGKAYDYGFPFKKIYINDNTIYQMIPEEKAVSIYVIPWAKTLETRITNDMVEEYTINKNIATASLNNVTASNASVSVTRETALDRAYQMCGTGWVYNPETMFTPTTTVTCAPEHLAKITSAKTVGGIPYCWGGMNGLDTATYSGSSAGYMQNFSDCLTSGKTAGNISTVSQGWVGGTFGIDCSGFICATFKIPKKVGTSDLPDYFTECSSWSSVQAGDVGIKTGHTFMIRHVYSSSTSGIYTIGTYESTLDGSADCAKLHNRDYADVCNEYNLYTY